MNAASPGRRICRPFVMLALETGARYNTIRTLQWSNIDFANRCLKFGKDKTPSGTGRTVPLNQRAIETLKFWAQQFPNRLARALRFPAGEVRRAGRKRLRVRRRGVYDTDPITADRRHQGSMGRRRRGGHSAIARLAKAACWRTNRKPKRGYVCESCQLELHELPAGLVAVRFHDLRHTAVSRMIAARVPLPIIAKIVGWSAGTMAKMAARYGHFGMEELRGAVEDISRIPEESSFEAGSPANFPAVRGARCCSQAC